MLALIAVLALFVPTLQQDVDYKADMAFACEAIEKECKTLLQSKKIDWKKVTKQFTKESKKVKTETEQWILLVRLLARLQDGHARVIPPDGLAWRDQEPTTGSGLLLCKVGKKLYIKNSRGDAAGMGLVPGMELLKIDGKKSMKWLDARVEEMGDMSSFSTATHALYTGLNWGLDSPIGTRLDLELKFEGKKKRRTLTFAKTKSYTQGPAFLPAGVEVVGRDHHAGKLGPDFGEEGFGYIHLRRVTKNLEEELDGMLAKLGRVPGLIIDCRGNSGGGCDHDAVFGRFVPKGKELDRGGAYPIPSGGSNPYGGPIVVIIDGNIRSAGETVSGMFKEDGRGYMIGESTTAGMSAQKTTIPLPSGRFSLYVSTGSNKSRFNGGRGIEGVGIIPHELVEFTPKDLTLERDTLILRAVEILRDFPQDQVRYDPVKYEW